MKLRATRRSRLESHGGAEDAFQALTTPSEATPEERRERLYRAIERAQASMHRSASPQSTMESIRRWFPDPLYFIESGRQATEKAGVSQLDAFYYAMIPSLTRTSLSQQWGVRPDLGSLSRMLEYLRALYVGIHVERFYLILLNRQGRLIRSVMLQEGGVDSAPFYLRQVLSAALAEGAKYIVLAHNHPGGTRNPSHEDLACTLHVLNAVSALGIPLLDHIIVVPDGAVSIRETGLLPDLLWNAAGPGSRLVRDWLDVELLVD